MKQNPQKSTEKPISDPFESLTDSQWRFVTACVENPDFNKKQAAEYIGIEPNTTYKWGGHVDAAVKLAREDSLTAAKTMRRQMLLKAMAVKLKGLDSKDETIAQKAATEIIEWELGKAIQKSETDMVVEITDKTEARERLAHLIANQSTRTGTESDSEYTH